MRVEKKIHLREAAEAHECLGGFSVLTTRRKSGRGEMLPKVDV